MSESVDIMVGRRLRSRRRLLGISQQSLGAACGVTFQQIHKYEAAVCRMSAVMLWNLANALDVEISYFFTGLPDPDAAYEPLHDTAAHRETASHREIDAPRAFSAAP